MWEDKARSVCPLPDLFVDFFFREGKQTTLYNEDLIFLLDLWNFTLIPNYIWKNK